MTALSHLHRTRGMVSGKADSSMQTQRLTIKQNTREHPIWLVRPEDFNCDSPVDIDPEEIARNPRFSLYCVDEANRCMVFVETDNPQAVDDAPFYYQAQAEHAKAVVSMPFETFHRVANEIAPPPKGLIFVHSVGRCGSTLLSKVLAAIPEVHSLSEPDDITQLARMRVTGSMPNGDIRDLLASSIRWRGKPRAGSAAEFVAIKPRAEVMILADLFETSFPDAKHFFLYRDGLSWMRTLFRNWPEDRDVYDVELNRKMLKGWSDSLPILKQFIDQDLPLNPIQIRMYGWITFMEAYMQMAAAPIETAAACFEDLTTETVPILAKFFQFCGIDAVDWTQIHEVLGKDSQAGTIYDREERMKQNRQLTDALVQDVLDLVASRPFLLTPNVVLPKTLTP